LLLLIAGHGVAAQDAGFPLDTWLLRESDLGSRRAGTLCLPEGVLRWSHVSAADEAINRRLVGDIVRAAYDGHVPSGLGAELLVMGVKSCARGYALGRRHILSGSGTILVRWSIGGDRETAAELSSHFAFKAVEAGSGAILAAAIRASVADLRRVRPAMGQERP
jgi:hypothetical protein